MTVKLSKRLSALAEMVTPGSRLADVGTDHGYIPVFLCQTGKIPSAIAMDVNSGPLERAKAHIAQYHLEGRIQTRLSDGLHKLLSGEADSVLIAGMGGGLVQKILLEGGHALEGVSELILQPQSEIARTRSFLRENGFVIADENMVEEDGRFYPMMKAHKLEGRTRDPGEGIQKMEDQFGPVLLKTGNPVLGAWLERELEIADSILHRLDGQLEMQPANEKLILRRQEISEKRTMLLGAQRLMKRKCCE